jgi:hypothetical protein
VRRYAAVLLLVAFAVGAAAWKLTDVKPDPNVQAMADGCQRDTTKIYTGLAPNWVYVNDKDYPASGPPPSPRWVSGTVEGPLGLLASRVASSDDPITHHSYDMNVDVTVDPANDFLTGVSRDSTPEHGTIHLERESAYIPFWAWPKPGDRLQALGSWVWDCDHYQGTGEKTEFHPIRALFSNGGASAALYASTDATPAGKQAECAHQTKGSASFKSCAHGAGDWLSVNGDYALTLGPGSWRMIDRGSVNAPAVAIAGGVARFTVAAPTGDRVVVAKQFVRTGAAGTRLRLQFDRLLVRRAMDPSCPVANPNCPYKNESTLLGQISTSPGEWQLYWSVNGVWGRWPGTLAAKDGSVFRGSQSVDFFAQAGRPWTLVVLARDCDFGALPGWDGPGRPTLPCPRSNEIGNSTGDDYAGAITVTQKGLGLGRHVANASTAGSSCPPSNTHGCYQLTYTVSRVR